MGAIWLLFAATLFAVPIPDSEQTRGGHEDAAIRDLLARMADACGVVGKGTVRVLVIPMHLMSPQKRAEEVAASDSVPGQEAAGEVAEPEGEEVPKKAWLPNTMVEGKLTSAADVAYEIDRLREVTNLQQGSRAGAPSPVLLSLFEASQREAKKEGMVTARTPAPIGEHLGRGVPWRPQETIAPVEPAQVAQSVSAPPKEEPKRSGGGAPWASSRKLVESSFRLARPPQQGAVQPTSAKKSGVPGKTTPASSEPIATGEGGYVAVVFRGPFQVFDERPGQTILIELEGDQVGRVREQGKEWAWLQLDSGLMGVMRNKYLRSATPQEVRQFLDMEGLVEAGQAAEDFQIGVIDLDSAGVPIQSEAGLVPPGGKVGGPGTSGKAGAGEPKPLKPSR